LVRLPGVVGLLPLEALDRPCAAVSPDAGPLAARRLLCSFNFIYTMLIMINGEGNKSEPLESGDVFYNRFIALREVSSHNF